MVITFFLISSHVFLLFYRALFSCNNIEKMKICYFLLVLILKILERKDVKELIGLNKLQKIQKPRSRFSVCGLIKNLPTTYLIKWLQEINVSMRIRPSRKLTEEEKHIEPTMKQRTLFSRGDHIHKVDDVGGIGGLLGYQAPCRHFLVF